MRDKLYEHTSFDDLNAEGRGKSRLLPLLLAFDKIKGKANRITIPLKTSKDYYTLYQQLCAAGSKISIKNARNEEIGPDKFAKCFELLGIEDSTDLQDFIEDYTYRQILENNGIKFSFSKETRNNIILPAERTIKSNSRLSDVGITDEEGVTWEWGTTEDEDRMKVAPEGRDIWVIRAHEYPDYPCMFLYPYEGTQITPYSTALDIFFMNKSKDTGIIYDFYNPKEFNLMWVACPCTYSYFLENPIPTPKEQQEAKNRHAKEQQIEDTDYDIEEELVIRDRNKLKRLVESYGKKDVLDYVKHLNESANNFVKIYMSVPVYDWIDDLNNEYNESMCDTDDFIEFVKNRFGIIASEAFDEVGYHEPGADSMSFLIPIDRKAIDFFGAEYLKQSIIDYIDDNNYDSPYCILEPTNKNELRKFLRIL